MGSWNETCVLTNTPIRVGMPVVALTAVVGPESYEAADSKSTALLFGLPSLGKYDDYGGVDNIENPAVHALNDSAFSAIRFYRRIESKSQYGSPRCRLLAAHPDTVWGVSDQIAPLYYGDFGLTLGDVQSYDPEPTEKKAQAYKRATAALEQLGSLLGSTEFSGLETEQDNQIFAVFQQVFGDKAWAAYQVLRGRGLFASRTKLLMHRGAYEAVVADFNRRRVGYFGNKQKMPLRSMVSDALDQWVDYYPRALAQAETMFGVGAGGRYLLNVPSSAQYLRPLSNMWMGSKHPLIGHFWEGATLDQVLATAAREELLDFFVFQWARAYLRISLTIPGCGSQNEEWVLINKAHKAAISALTADGCCGLDFSGTLHR